MSRLSIKRSWGLGIGTAFLLFLPLRTPVSVEAAPRTNKETCPKSFEPLISVMLAEIPAYANRVNTRANNPQNYVILASRADFEALPLLQASFPQEATSDSSSEVRQVFFSTLIRRFSQQEIVHHQEHHWLLMAPSDRGWEFVQMYSILDSYPASNLASAPRSSSEGSMATAIKDWLKNCHYQAAKS